MLSGFFVRRFHFGGDAGELRFRRHQQGFSFVAATLRQDRIETGHQPLVGKVGRTDLRQVAFIEQGPFQPPFLYQFADRFAAQRRKPAQARPRSQLVDLGLGEHPAVSHQHHPLQTKPLAEFVHLVGHRRRIARIAGIHVQGQRATVVVGHHAVDDARQIASPIAVVAEAGQGTSPPE